MCTVLAFFHSHSAAPLIIAANRDEFFDRPAAGPTCLIETPIRVIGGRDLRAGGTWMGVNQRGLFVGLTNIRSQAPDRRSRGEIVLEMLQRDDPESAREALLEAVRRDRYRPFNVLFGTSHRLMVAHVRDEALELREVEPGIHVLPSGGRLDDEALPKVRRALQGMRAIPEQMPLEAVLERAKIILADHVQPPVEALPPALRQGPLPVEFECALQAICVHTPVYGTRSATIMVLDGGLLRYEYTEGASCRPQWKRVEELLPTAPASKANE
jgi:uncharacterized protein with NRDE domain